MESIEHIGLTFQTPEHGWLPVRLQLNAFVIGCSVSNVLNDPVHELIGAMESCLVPNGPRQRVCFWLEPEGYAIDILPGTSPDQRIVRVSYDRSFVPPMPDCEMKVVFEGEAGARLITGALLPPIAQLVQQKKAVKTWKRLDSPDYPARIAEIQRAWTNH